MYVHIGIPHATLYGARSWKRNRLPRKILIIRLQAMGDVMITLPYLQYLRRQLPDHVLLDFLTREETASVPQSIQLFNQVYKVGGGRSFRKQCLYALAMLPALLWQRYDIVIDLQNNTLSQWLVKMMHPRAYTFFDRFSPIPAGERTRLTIESIGLGHIQADTKFVLKANMGIETLLKRNGWYEGHELVVLNPAGAFATRNWPVSYYIRFARLWLEQYTHTQFLLLGVGLIAAKAEAIKNELGPHVVNLVDKTSPAQAFALIQQARLVLSEDSGLMHMAWISGVPTLALFGATRSDWARPLGAHTTFLDSGDLACGNCMLQTCRYGDNRCLTRYTPEMVLYKALSLPADSRMAVGE